MSDVITPAPIRKALTVRASPETAFRIFTEKFDRWWPRTHYLGSSPLVQAVLECGVGGRWYSLHQDGTIAPWGEVLVWEPPHRLVLAWRISHRWGYDPGLLTEVEVRLTDLGGGETRVDFEHRNLERFGDTPEAAATIASMDGGWGSILTGYVTAAEAEQTVRDTL